MYCLWLWTNTEPRLRVCHKDFLRRESGERKGERRKRREKEAHSPPSDGVKLPCIVFYSQTPPCLNGRCSPHTIFTPKNPLCSHCMQVTFLWVTSSWFGIFSSLITQSLDLIQACSVLPGSVINSRIGKMHSIPIMGWFQPIVGTNKVFG